MAIISGDVGLGSWGNGMKIRQRESKSKAPSKYFIFFQK